MKNFVKTILILLIFSWTESLSQDYLYILDDKCINDLMIGAEEFFVGTEISAIRDSRGILLRYALTNPLAEISELDYKTYQNSLKIKEFLAKIENPAIIEVHTENVGQKNQTGYKNWEVSTVIANNIESVILSDRINSMRHRISSIGYGEFLPSKNTSNNGGKYSNRVDIIILCSISGE